MPVTKMHNFAEQHTESDLLFALFALFQSPENLFLGLTMPLHTGKYRKVRYRELKPLRVFRMTASRLSFLSFASLVALLAFQAKDLDAQYRIHGTIFDKNSGEHLVAATVYDTIAKTGAVSNEYGFFSLEAPPGRVLLNISYVGYQSRNLVLDLVSDTAVDVYLEPSLEIGEVTISAHSAEQEFLSSQMSAHSIHHLETRKIPQLFGEPDLIKALQYLPGVSAGIEGTSGIFVRGGGSDQNLILLDGIPVYNVSHLFGLFSVFNGDAINSATIYKGGFPARYSGRLSSVLDIRMKEGNMQSFQGSASIGLIASKFMLEGPIVKGRTSFLLSGRRSYADVLSYPVQYKLNKDNNLTNTYLGYFFHDLNAKINHRFSERSRLYLSSYLGRDEFYIKDGGKTIFGGGDRSGSGFYWGNQTFSMRWNQIWSPVVFSNLTLAYSRFNRAQYVRTRLTYTDGEGKGETPLLEEAYYSRVQDLSARLDFSIDPFVNHDVRAGLGLNLYRFEPGTTTEDHYLPGSGLFSQQFGADTVHAFQIGGYLEDDFSIGQRLRMNLGINASVFRVEGRDYFSPEPRASARFLLAEGLALKTSYAQMSQRVHLLTNTMVGVPTDSWVPSTAKLPPERSRQSALGISYTCCPGIRFSLEAYYKEMKNLVEYADGAELQMNDRNWEERIFRGEGTAYGLEFYAQKESGALTGSLAYTLSKNTRSFPEINFGKPFPYKYDRRHDLSITANWKLNERITLGAVWVLASGVNLTILDHSYFNPLDLMDIEPGVERQAGDSYEGDIIHNFAQRNGYKLPPYHRLDLGLNFEKQKKRVLRTWSFGAHNIYNRKNPFYISSGLQYKDSGDLEKHVYQVTMLPFLPYFRYSIRF
ncbi:MAG: TonB-dependent receptor [Bacteroidetes bacterium]|nr:MAG: TonB-dependent receptor [Bacteroidota bacterium]